MQQTVVSALLLWITLAFGRAYVVTLIMEWPRRRLHGHRSIDSEWTTMVLRFSSEQSTCLVATWAITAILSAVGWLLAFITVWQDINKRPTDTNAFERDNLYMQICICQFFILITWTTMAFAVQPRWPWWWRGLSVILNLALVASYLAAATVFSSIKTVITASEYTKFTGMMLYVQALHTLAWDCIWLGYSYSNFFDEYQSVQRCWVLPLY